MKALGTAACPPYHIAFVVGGLSADQALKVAKLASTKYYDNLPTSGNELGQAFRDTSLEAALLKASREFGIGAQFGGKYFAHDIRVIRLPRHGAPAYRNGAFLLRRPKHQSQNQQTRHLAGEAGT
jgi:fumarate hydratase class I